MMHKNMSGNRHSDHVALLIAFQQWLKAKWNGEDVEKDFCERRALNMQTLRMTYEARNQLKDIMISSGFPEECLHENASFDAYNNDSKLDLITSLLCYALYPNVCFHTEKRKLITCDAKQALIHKYSVNCSRENTTFPSPFFVFGEKIKTRAVSAKQMTMVSPVQLLLFASEKIETVDSNSRLICLDNWIYLNIEPNLARLVLSMRTALDSVLANCTLNPSQIINRPKHIEMFFEVLNLLSDQNGRHVIFKKDNENSQGSFMTSSSGSFNYSQNQAQSNVEPQLKRLAQSLQESLESCRDNNLVEHGTQGSVQVQSLMQTPTQPSTSSYNFNQFGNGNFQRNARGGGYRGGSRGGNFSNSNQNFNRNSGSPYNSYQRGRGASSFRFNKSQN